MSSSSGLDNTRIARILAASDVAYFKAAAENSRCLDGVLSLIPGFTDLSLACVLHSLSDIEAVDSWVEEFEAIIVSRGVRWARFYLQQVSDSQRELLLKKGYRELVEIGFATTLAPRACSDMILKPCQSEADWQQYTELSLMSGQGPDGFDMAGDSYARVSRLKVDAGYMSPYLAVLQDSVVGFTNLSLQGDFARSKNLLVHPDHRNQGVGSIIIKAAMLEAREQGAKYFGCYAIAGEPSVALYSSLGMVEVTRQFEWSRQLSGT